MEQNAAATAFATLGHPDRLAVFRLLMRFAPRGVRPTEIAAALGIKANTLSHHLAELAGAGLVQVSRQGRSLYYRANLPVTEALCYGKASLLSDSSSLPEAGGDHVVYFPVGDQKALTEALDDEELEKFFDDERKVKLNNIENKYLKNKKIEMCKLEKELDELVWADDVDESEYKFKIKK